MSIRHSYDGTISRTTNLKSLDHEISKILIRSKFPSEGEDIKFVTDSHDDVDSFIHPYWRQEEDVVYLDARGYSTVTADGTVSYRYGEDYDMALYRAKLELAWVRGDKHELFSSFQLANEIFVRWLSSLITHRYNLSPVHELRLLCCVALFNIGRYFNSIDGFRQVEKYVQQITVQYRLPVDTAFEIADYCEGVFPRNIDEFLELVHKANVSPALKDLNRLTLFNAIGGSFFMVSNAQAIVGLGLEYPPAFVAMVLMAMKNTTIRNKTQIGQRTEMTCNKASTAFFLRAVETTIEKHLGHVKPGRALGNESYPGNESAILAGAAAVGASCVFITFMVWLLDKVFGGDSSPSKRAEKAESEIKKVFESFASDEATIRKAVEAIDQTTWPDDEKLKALTDEQRQIWQKLSGMAGGVAGAKLAIFEFAKSGGSSSVISPGPLKYDNANSGKFSTSLKAACDYLKQFANDKDPLVQSLTYALFSNKPFSIGEQNNRDMITKLGQSFDTAVGILEKIKAATDAKDAGALSAVEKEIDAFNTSIGALTGKAAKQAGEAEANATRGTAGAVKHFEGMKSKTLQLFDKEDGSFNAKLKDPENVQQMQAIIKTYTDSNAATTLAKENTEAAKQLNDMAKNHKSKFDNYKSLGVDMGANFEDTVKQTPAWKKANTFITGKNDLLNYVQDAVNNSNNVSKSLLTLSTSITAMRNAIAVKAVTSGS